MKILLLGAKGQLGQDLQRTKPEGIDLLPLGRKELDVTCASEVMKVVTELRPSVIINATAYVKVDQAEIESEQAFLVNTVALKYLSQAAQETGAVLVHFSTDYVFDGQKLKLKEPYLESDLPNPINIYGLSKWAGELVLRNYWPKHYLFRVASLYGVAGASGKGGNFVYTILKKARTGEPLKVVADIFMSPTYTLDVAQMVWKVLKEAPPFGLYHLTNQGSCSWYQFAQEILTLAGLKTKIEPVDHTQYPARARRPLWSPLSSERGLLLRPWPEALKAFLKEIGAC